MKIYIGGPMTGLFEYNYPAFNKAATLLRRNPNYTVVNPASLGRVEGWTHAQYMKRDIPYLLECDAIALLPGWGWSRGATLEHNLAQHLDMKVFYLTFVTWPGKDTEVIMKESE